MAQDEFPAQRGEEVGLAAPGQAEGQHVDGTFDEASLDQGGQLPPHLGRQQRLVERAERLGLGQAGFG